MERAVLYVDSDRDSIHLLVKQVKSEPYELLWTDKSEEALLMLETHPVQLVIIGSSEGGIDSSLLSKLIISRFPDVKIIFLAVENQLNSVLKELGSHAAPQDILTKPWNPDELKSLIQKSLQEYESFEEASDPGRIRFE